MRVAIELTTKSYLQKSPTRPDLQDDIQISNPPSQFWLAYTAKVWKNKDEFLHTIDTPELLVCRHGCRTVRRASSIRVICCFKKDFLLIMFFIFGTITSMLYQFVFGITGFVFQVQ